VLQGQLHIVLQGAAQSYAAATLEQLAALVIEHLQLLIEHCQSPEAGGFTPSDFPEADLEQADLDRFLSKLGGTTRF
jgi:fengycin family lipopeptide synthetase B